MTLKKLRLSLIHQLSTALTAVLLGLASVPETDENRETLADLKKAINRCRELFEKLRAVG